MPGHLTIREQILEAIEDHFRAQQAGVGSDPYTIKWSIVDRVELDDIGHGKRYTLSLLEGISTIVAGVSTTEGTTTKTLALAAEFKAFLNKSDKPFVEANRIIGEIVRRMLEDETYGGLAIWIQEAGDELLINGQNDRQIEGTVFFNILYRHSRRDPRQELC